MYGGHHGRYDKALELQSTVGVSHTGVRLDGEVPVQRGKLSQEAADNSPTISPRDLMPLVANKYFKGIKT